MLSTVARIFRKEWELLRDPDASWIRGLRFEDRVPVALPDRPTEPGRTRHLAARGTDREIQNAAREMEEEGNWYSALELYLELVRRTEKSDDHELDVTIYNRIAELHRRLTLEWYVEAADRYAMKNLRRGTRALCEKALRLDPEQHHVRIRLRRFLQAATEERAETEEDPRKATPGFAEPEPEEAARPAGRSRAVEQAPGESEAGALAAEAGPAPRAHEAAGEPGAGTREVPTAPSRGRRDGTPRGPGTRGAPHGATTDAAEGEPVEARGEGADPAGGARPARTRESEIYEPPLPGSERAAEEPSDRPPIAGSPPRGAEAEPGASEESPSARWTGPPLDPLPSRVVVPIDEDERGLRRRVRRVVVTVGAALLAALIAILIVF